MSAADADDVAAANAALYEAFETADVDRMSRVWDEVDPDAVVCVHPGWPMLRGRDTVLRSWSAVMAGTDYIQFFLTDVQVTVLGDTAIVTCQENVLTEVSCWSERPARPSWVSCSPHRTVHAARPTGVMRPARR